MSLYKFPWLEATFHLHAYTLCPENLHFIDCTFSHLFYGTNDTSSLLENCLIIPVWIDFSKPSCYPIMFTHKTRVDPT